jgi:nucleotide-binding universal stress UspA family protein
MFQKVIVGVDEHEGSRDAIGLAQHLVGKGGQLILAHVHHGYATSVPSPNADYRAQERERATQLLTTARDGAGVEAQLAPVGSPSVGRGLHELADARGADLLVVGSTRRGGIGRVLLGDDTRHALVGAPCAVAIAPAGYSQHAALMREIGVGYDGSPESQNALEEASEIAAEHGAKLSAFEAVYFPRHLFPRGRGPHDASIDDLVKQARERIAALGGVEPHAAYGHPAEELALYGASVDLLVLGSRAYGPIARLGYGSTSQQLARTARCPLLVLTRASATEAGAGAPASAGAIASAGEGSGTPAPQSASG